MIRPTPVRHDGTTCTEFDFFFKTNIQGDVLAVYNASGTEVMKITYDAWGNFTDTVSTMPHPPSTEQLQALAIPFRYRGYVYDQETGFYYLNSRYYDPVMHKFLNADGLVSTGQGLLGNNMYAYCNNNPVMYADYCGYEGVTALVVGIVAVALLIIITCVIPAPTDSKKGIYENPYNDYRDWKPETYPSDPLSRDGILTNPGDAPSNDKGLLIDPIPQIEQISVITSQATKSKLKKLNLPTSGKIRFIPPKNGQIIGNKNTGFLDRFGNRWKQGPTRTAGEYFEWDVQLSNTGRTQLGWLSRDGNHINVSWKGHVTHK